MRHAESMHSNTIPNKVEQTIRFVGAYSTISRDKRLALEAQALSQDPSYSPLHAPIVERPSKRAVSKSWARLIKKIYACPAVASWRRRKVDPLICLKWQLHEDVAPQLLISILLSFDTRIVGYLIQLEEEII